jgi:transposase
VLYAGDDWAEDHHDVALVDQAGRRLARARLNEGMAGIARFHELIADHLPEGDGPGQVVIGIETGRGPWVTALVASGYQVYAVNPLSVARYRERHSVSGAKSDAGDAWLLADLVRTDAARHRPVAGDSPAAEGIKVLARAHQRLIWSVTALCYGCAARCASTSPPRWQRSRTWMPPTRWSCWPAPPSRGPQPG